MGMLASGLTAVISQFQLGILVKPGRLSVGYAQGAGFANFDAFPQADLQAKCGECWL